MNPTPVLSFTVEYSRIVNVLSTNVQVGAAFDLGRGEKPTPLRPYVGIWDTGASASVITQKVVDELGLKPIGVTQVSHAHGQTTAEQYLIQMTLPNNGGFPSLRVTRGVLAGIDLLIGMDVISQGDFSVTGYNGKTVMSFRIPSVQRIDFVSSQVPKQKPVTSAQKVGRNDPCPCGSGKKYKKCCGH